ncbi:lytic transglycosylase [Porphyrobacter sp. HT-58-2]|uniref:lytic transglycosylase domain-containing protein n=1 Tax=Porphyrobacter sp. HT-58-2 TaxID=2023229 RepID=UPI000CDCA489|nr:lytic transglycosylase domain-containing protein [Porphyrobacter sp. HT-58-2]AUX70912.1 lytic transglycosylase [Porphyrobacter sp. HT-58-2]
MNLKFFLLAGIAVLAVPEVPTRAQDRPKATGSEHDSTKSGFRIVESSNGFQLVEHGLWASPKSLGALATQADEAPSSYSPWHLQAATGTSSFRRASYLPHVYAAEVRYALPTGLLDALVWTESRYNPLAVSHTGAAGLGQLMPATARELGVTNRFDPVSNIDGAARYLRQMLDRFGVVHLALAAYNAGPGAVTKAGGIPRNGETPAYVRNVLRRWKL